MDLYRLINWILKLKSIFKSDMRLLVFSGDLLPAKLINRIRNIYGTYSASLKIINLYGQTETLGSMAYLIPDDFTQNEGIVPVGYPLAKTEIILIDEAFNVLNNIKPTHSASAFFS